MKHNLFFCLFSGLTDLNYLVILAGLAGWWLGWALLLDGYYLLLCYYYYFIYCYYSIFEVVLLLDQVPKLIQSRYLLFHYL